MTNEIDHQIYSRFMRQQPEYSELNRTHASCKETVKSHSYQDDDLIDRVGLNNNQYSESDHRNNRNAVIMLFGSFVVMSLVSLTASIFFPTPSTQANKNTNAWDITPIITPVRVMEFD